MTGDRSLPVPEGLAGMRVDAGLARLLGLPPLETQVVVLLASLAVGANVYLMARHFKVLEGPVAGSLILSTMLSALTTPLIVSLLG